MRDIWRQPAPAGMGVTNVSKQLTPRHYAEEAGDPTRTLLLLRAWALWRAGQGGWASLQRGRARHFKEQEVLLERDIKALGASCKLLGPRNANSLLRGWAPEAVARLLHFMASVWPALRGELTDYRPAWFWVKRLNTYISYTLASQRRRLR